jgi:hypothetical protein
MDENPSGDQNPSNTGADTTAINEEVKFEDDELNTIEETTSKKIKTLDAQKRHWREKAQRAEDEARKATQELSELKAKNSPPPAPVSAPQPIDVETAARKVAMDMERDKMIMGLPEDKRGSVKEVYTAITAGKTVDISNLNDYMETAMRAVGIDPRVNTSHRITSSSHGSVPPTTPPGPTKEQVELAQKLGNDPEKVYGQKADYSRMANAEKFMDKN